MSERAMLHGSGLMRRDVGPDAARADAPQDADQAHLIRAAQADVAAFDVLYECYLDRVYAYVRAHARSADEAADLTQQVFLQVLQALPAYRPQGVPFAIWLFRIARHLVIDTHRHHRPTIQWSLISDSDEPTSGESLETLAIRQEETRRMRSTIMQLAPPQRELLALRYTAGLSAPEIATVLGKTPAAVRKQLSRTIALLKELYDAN